MKRYINYLFRKLGFEPINQELILKEVITKKWIESFSLDVIIDIGSSDGGFSRKIKNIFPNATIYCFEALPNSYERLLQKNEKMSNFHAFNVALSNEKGEIDFYKCENNTGSSSILEMNNVHKEAYPFTAENTKISVKADRLDEFSQDFDLQNKNVMLKLDVQGAERIVLEGAIKTLEQVDYIFCEMNFIETYKNCVLFGELNSFFEEYGFILSGMENISQNNKTGEFLQADAYFKKMKK